MKLLGFRLENIGPVQSASLITSHHHNGSTLTLITGQQGSGKSFVIKSLAQALSWVSARIKNERQNGTVINEADLRHETTYGEIEIRLQDIETSDLYSLNIIRQPQATGPNDRVELHEVPNLTQKYRANITESSDSNIPLIAYYPAIRFTYEFLFQPRASFTTPEQYEALDPTIPILVDLRRVSEWFREQEDIEQEQFSKLLKQQFPDSDKIITYPELTMIYQRLEQQRRIAAAPGLNAVRQALKLALPGYQNWRIERRPKAKLLVDKANQTMDIHQLSLSEKNIFALTVDLCRRLTMCNPSLINPALGNGIVVIDDIDQGVESSALENWLKVLPQIFPNLQIVASLQSAVKLDLLKQHQSYRLETLASMSHDYLTSPRALNANYVITTHTTTEKNIKEDDLSQVWPLPPADQCSLIFNANGSVTTINMAKIVIPPVEKMADPTASTESTTPLRTQAAPIAESSDPPIVDDTPSPSSPKGLKTNTAPPKSK